MFDPLGLHTLQCGIYKATSNELHRLKQSWDYICLSLFALGLYLFKSNPKTGFRLQPLWIVGSLWETTRFSTQWYFPGCIIRRRGTTSITSEWPLLPKWALQPGAPAHQFLSCWALSFSPPPPPSASWEFQSGPSFSILLPLVYTLPPPLFLYSPLSIYSSSSFSSTTPLQSSNHRPGKN